MKKGKYSGMFLKAAKAAGMAPEKFAEAIQGLLYHSKCMNTTIDRPIFRPSVLRAISR